MVQWKHIFDSIKTIKPAVGWQLHIRYQGVLWMWGPNKCLELENSLWNGALVSGSELARFWMEAITKIISCRKCDFWINMFTLLIKKSIFGWKNKALSPKKYNNYHLLDMTSKKKKLIISADWFSCELVSSAETRAPKVKN